MAEKRGTDTSERRAQPRTTSSTWKTSLTQIAWSRHLMLPEALTRRTSKWPAYSSGGICAGYNRADGT